MPEKRVEKERWILAGYTYRVMVQNTMPLLGAMPTHCRIVKKLCYSNIISFMHTEKRVK
jgi:hypothetical protein